MGYRSLNTQRGKLKHKEKVNKSDLSIGQTGAKSNGGEMQQSQYLAQLMSLGIVIHNVVVQFDNPPFHPKMVGEMLSYRIFLQKTSFDDTQK